MTNEEYARFLKTWDWAEFGAIRLPSAYRGEMSKAGAVGNSAVSGSGPQPSEPERAPAAPIQPGAGDVGQGDLLPSKAGTAEEASAPPAPTQGALL